VVGWGHDVCGRRKGQKDQVPFLLLLLLLSSSLIQIDPTALLLLLFAKRSLSVALAEKESGKWLAIIY
jgi:hypothetical protein